MPPKKKDEKKHDLSTLSGVLASAAEEFDLHTMGLDEVADNVEVIPTGNMELDLALGVGGFPRGRSGEFYGPPGSGKTSTALQMCGYEVQRIIREGTSEHVLYVDYEHALDFDYAESLGVDRAARAPDGLPVFLYNAPDTLEQGAAFIKRAVGTGVVRLVILDSLAAMTPQKEAEGEITTHTEVALQARLIKQFGKQMNPLLDANNCAMIYLNHEGKEIPMGWTPPGYKPKATTPGGNGPKFFASVRLAFSQWGTYEGKVWDEVTNDYVKKTTGHNVTVKVVKNKVAAPFKVAEVRTRYGYGLDNFLSAWKILELRKRVYKGAWSGTEDPALLPPGEKFNKEGKWQRQGEDAILQYADEHPEWKQTMIEAALAELEKSKLKDTLVATVAPSTEELADLIEGAAEE